ncbi:MAG TPA: acyl-CoA desaturase [Kofleriaceae bacterium]|nr:acyl-CoA desaturase [Kofleriaceae bacterium]
MGPKATRAPFLRQYFHPASWPFWGIHLVAIVGVIMTGWSWTGLGLAVAFYGARMFFVAAGYHRYFSHRTFKTSRTVQFLLALFSTTTAQKGVLWWAAHHRRHHKYSDQPEDTHSAKLEGFWYSHVGWVVTMDPERERIDLERVKDLSAFPELRLLERFNLVPPFLLAAIVALIGGWHALLWGFFVSTVLLWHGTFTVNSLNHVIGRRRYATSDESRNNWFLALFVTMGEGWHNNHHHYMTSANQGFFWWEIDVTFYALVALEKVGIIWDLRRAPAHVVRGEARVRAPELPAGGAATQARPTAQSAERR